MKTIKIDNFPGSKVILLVENYITFAYNWGHVMMIGTCSVEKLKKRLIKIGMSPSEVESLSCEVVDLDKVSDVYDF